MAIEGELSIRLDWDGARVIGVDVRSNRPRVAGGLLRGKPAGAAVALLPRLYGICAHAQVTAARLATTAATDPRRVESCAAAGAAAVALETIQEYLWRLLIDWPQAMGQPPQVAVVAGIRHVLAQWLAQHDAAESPRPPAAVLDAIDDTLRGHVIGEPLAAFLARSDADAFDRWVAATDTLPARLFRDLIVSEPGLGRSSTALMPDASPDVLREAVVPAMQDDEFDAAPAWNGMTVETGALSRRSTQPLVASLLARDGRSVTTRMAARLCELARLASGLRQAEAVQEDGAVAPFAFALSPGDGIAAVETARGLLLHRASIVDGTIADYRIVAPTEWNFHPAGPLVQGWEGWEVADRDRLLRGARLCVQALDPCVACDLAVGHA